MMKSFTTLSVGSVLVSSALVVNAGHLPASPGQHKGVAKRMLSVADNSTSGSSELSKRYSGVATYYYAGLGACGKYFSDSDWVVALNSPQYGGGYPGPECWKTLTIHANGKSATAQVYDECPPCDYGSLDLTPSLFSHFNDLGVGVFDITWEWGSGGDSGGGGSDSGDDGGDDDHSSHHDDSSDDDKKSTSTKKHHHSTTTTKKHSSTTTTKKHSTSTTKASSSTTTKLSTSTTATSASETATPSQQANLGSLEQVVINMQHMLAYAHQG